MFARDITAASIAVMGREELLEAKLSLCADLDHVTQQLKEAARQAEETGQYADREWYNRAFAAKKIMGRLDQAMALRLRTLRLEQAEKNRAEHQRPILDQHQRFLHEFFRIASATLVEDDLRALISEAQASAESIEVLCCMRCAQAEFKP